MHLKEDLLGAEQSEHCLFPSTARILSAAFPITDFFCLAIFDSRWVFERTILYKTHSFIILLRLSVSDYPFQIFIQSTKTKKDKQFEILVERLWEKERSMKQNITRILSCDRFNAAPTASYKNKQSIYTKLPPKSLHLLDSDTKPNQGNRYLEKISLQILW